MIHSLFDGRVVDWLLIDRSVNLAILLLPRLVCALCLARHHCLRTTPIIKFHGGRRSILSARPSLHIALRRLYAANRVLRWPLF